MTRKNICLVTNWYPSKDNPDRGQFFREQALILKEHYDFIIVHLYERIGKKNIRRDFANKIKHEENIDEYEVTIQISLIAYLLDRAYKLLRIANKKDITEGAGRFASKWGDKYIRKKIINCFKAGIENRIDIFYCVDAQNEASLIKLLADEYQKPYIVGEHGIVPWPGSVVSKNNKEAIEKADAFLAISNDKIRQMMLLGIKLPPVFYIGNLIDETKFAVHRENSEKKTFIIIAAYSYIKNYDMFISVFNKLSDSAVKPFKVLIVGYAANKGYSTNMEELEKKIRESKFKEMVEMIPSIPHEEIGSVLNRADAFVMTSIQEGQPVSAMEAACCGLPIFSTRCGGVEDYVDDQIGRVYSIIDSDSMAEGLNSFLNGEIRFDSEYIRRKVIELFGIESFSHNFSKAVEFVSER